MKTIKGSTLFAVAALFALAQLPAAAQSQTINARMSGNGNGNGGGKCTFEVTVQGRAEVQIRGNQGRLVTESGNPAQWRRLDCNAPLPSNPTGFRFSGVDGHGRQSLAADPTSSNGVAVIQIDNGNRGNNEGYTGDITWTGGNGNSSLGNNGNGGWHHDHDRDHDGNSGNNGGWNNSNTGWQNGNGGWGNNNGGWQNNGNGSWNGNNGGWNGGGNGRNNAGGAPQFINARISGNGGGSGKCTFEVVVPGRAEVQIRGDQGRLISEDGSPSQWRRLDCNQPLPRNPSNFHFSGVDGHGRQSLAADPNSNNGVAVIQIDNGNRGNNEGYTGDITWR